MRPLQDVMAALDPGSGRNLPLEGIRMGSADLRMVTGSQSLAGLTAVPATPCARHPATQWAAYGHAGAAAWPARGGVRPATGPGSRTNCQGRAEVPDEAASTPVQDVRAAA